MWCYANYSQFPQMNTFGTVAKKCLCCWTGVLLIESKRKCLKNSRDQLDFLQVPHLLIILLYTFITLMVTILLVIFPLSLYYIK